jgi:hypothetical protein
VYIACSPGGGGIDATVDRREELSMRRLPTMLASAAAAALTTLAVTVAVPAIADNDTDWKSEDEFAACLRDHGAAGAPGGPALKPWLGQREERGDATVERALSACSPPKPGIARPGPSEQQLRSCLKEHGVEVPAGDGRALKQWLFEHGDDAANRDALKACDMAPPIKREVGGACFKEGAVGTGVPAGRAAKGATLESRGADVHDVSGAN